METEEWVFRISSLSILQFWYAFIFYLVDLETDIRAAEVDFKRWFGAPLVSSRKNRC
jgi:hypothetical protein